MRLVLFLLPLLFFKTLKAQEKPFELPIELKGGGKNHIKLNYIFNTDHTRNCVIFNNSSVIKAYCFDENMKFLTHSSSDGVNGGEVLGGFVKDQKAYVYVRDAGSPSVKTFVFSLTDASHSEFSIPFDLKGKKFLGQLSTESGFLYITADKKEPVITVFNFNSEDKIEQIDFDLSRQDLNTGFNKNDLWKALSRGSGLSRSVDAVVVNPDVECEPDVANALNKIYYRNDSLLLVMDKEEGTSRIFSLDLKGQSLAYKVIERKLEATKTLVTPTFNSFLIGDKLYYVRASSEQLVICVNELPGMTEVARYEAAVDDSIDFKNTPVLQDRGNHFAGSVRELERTKQLLRKMLSGRAVITGIRNADHLDELTIGAFKEMQRGGGGFYPGPAVGGFGGSFQAGGGVWIGAGFNPFGGSWNRITRFKMLINPETSKHVRGEIHASVAEQIRDYSKDLKIPNGGAVVFIVGNASRYAYYDKDTQKLVLMKF